MHVNFTLIKPFMTSAMFKDKRVKKTKLTKTEKIKRRLIARKTSRPV